MKCHSCNSNEHGGRDGLDFICFKCNKLSYTSGNSDDIRRRDDFWEVHVQEYTATGVVKQWIAVSHSFEEMYELYISKLIVS